MNSRNLRGTSFALATVPNPRRVLLPPLLWMALSIGSCQQSLGQHKALELGPEEAAPTLPASGVKAGNVRGNGDRLQARKEVQAQDCLGRLYPGRCGDCQPTGAISCHDGPLVHAC